MSAPSAVKLTSELVEAFAGTFLSPLYDNPQPTPDFHRECWDLYCTETPLAAIAAPRAHAKSTALTHDYVLATVLFREESHIVVVSATEDLAIGHLSDIAKELRENDDLIREFQVLKLETDAKTDIIVKFKDGHQARIRAKGAGQKMRGMKWNGGRPGLIVCDDLEEDEQVESLDRRKKFRHWFFRALLPCVRRGGKVRMHGTILHEDALLARVMNATTWKTRRYRAHRAFNDFSEILWPEQFPPERLKAIQLGFIEDGDAPGYSQEYLNDPYDNSAAYIRKDDLLPMKEKDLEADKINVVGVDFAVSKADTANKTAFTVVGSDETNLAHVHDHHEGRWDTLEWVDKMFEIQARHNPVCFFVEDGVIWKAVKPTIDREMQIRNTWMNCFPIPSIKDKAARGRTFQKRTRAGSVRFNKEAGWYAAYEHVLTRFTGTSEAKDDDAFDSTAIAMVGLERMAEFTKDDFISDEEFDMEQSDPRKTEGRCLVTGY